MGIVKTEKWLFVNCDDKRVLKLKCPGCGQWGYLDDHSVDECGQVVPSVDCPECNFHDLVILTGFPNSPYQGHTADVIWDGKEFKKRDNG